MPETIALAGECHDLEGKELSSVAEGGNLADGIDVDKVAHKIVTGRNTVVDTDVNPRWPAVVSIAGCSGIGA